MQVAHSANETTFDQIFESLLGKSNARAVVLFLRMEDARGLLLAAHRAQAPDAFIWIAADGWGKEMKLVENVEAVALGAITVELQSEPITEFDEYFRRRRYVSPNYPLGRWHVTGQRQRVPTQAELTEQAERNPWFKEYWEEVFQCSIPEAAGSQNDQPSSSTKMMMTMMADEATDVDDQFSTSHLIEEPLKNLNRSWWLKSNLIRNQNHSEARLLEWELESDRRMLQLLKEGERPLRRFIRSSGQSAYLFFFLSFCPSYPSSASSLPVFEIQKFLSFFCCTAFVSEYFTTCDPNLSLASVHRKQEPKIQFVVDAVYAFAHALHNAWLEKCGGRGKICTALREMDGGEFYNKYLLNVSFLGKRKTHFLSISGD